MAVAVALAAAMTMVRAMAVAMAIAMARKGSYRIYTSGRNVDLHSAGPLLLNKTIACVG